MEYFLGAISLVSLVLNYLVYRRVTASYVVGTLEELEPAEYCCCKEVIKLLESLPSEDEAHDPPPVTVAMVQGVYSAWSNQKEIPWVPPTAPPEPINKAPNKPLERPDGFI